MKNISSYFKNGLAFWHDGQPEVRPVQLVNDPVQGVAVVHWGIGETLFSLKTKHLRKFGLVLKIKTTFYVCS
jgi:hypothetical protein